MLILKLIKDAILYKLFNKTPNIFGYKNIDKYIEGANEGSLGYQKLILLAFIFGWREIYKESTHYKLNFERMFSVYQNLTSLNLKPFINKKMLELYSLIDECMYAERLAHTYCILWFKGGDWEEFKEVMNPFRGDIYERFDRIDKEIKEKIAELDVKLYFELNCKGESYKLLSASLDLRNKLKSFFTLNK